MNGLVDATDVGVVCTCDDNIDSPSEYSQSADSFVDIVDIDDNYEEKHTNPSKPNTAGKVGQYSDGNDCVVATPNENGNQSEDTALSIVTDKGWAWFILGGSTFSMFIIIGIMKCFGIFFVQMQHRFKSSSSATSMIYTIQNIAYSISALFVMTIGQSISSRTSVLCGTFLFVASNLLTGFANDIYVVYFTGGLLTGLANAFIEPQLINMIGIYFKKYIGLANNICLAGCSLGGLVMAPLITKLFEIYGFAGTHIIVAGLYLNIAVVGLLLRPNGAFKTKQRDTVMEEEKCDMLEKIIHNYKEEPVNSEEFVMNCDSNVGRNVKRTDRVTYYAGTESVINSEVAQFASISSLYSRSMKSLNTVANDNAIVLLQQRHKNKSVKLAKTTCDIFLKLFDFQLLTKPVFIYFLVCNLFLCAGHVLVSAYIAPHGVDMGIDNDRVAWLVSVSCIVDVCTRAPFGYLADKRWIKISTLVALSAFILGMCSFGMFAMKTFSTIIAFSVVVGLLQGGYFALYVVLLLDILPPECFKSALGFNCVIQGMGIAATLPLAGYLRDYTGGYYIPYTFTGSLLIIGSLMCFFIPNVQTWSDKKTQHSKHSIVTQRKCKYDKT